MHGGYKIANQNICICPPGFKGKFCEIGMILSFYIIIYNRITLTIFHKQTLTRIKHCSVTIYALFKAVVAGL